MHSSYMHSMQHIQPACVITPVPSPLSDASLYPPLCTPSLAPPCRRDLAKSNAVCTQLEGVATVLEGGEDCGVVVSKGTRRATWRVLVAAFPELVSGVAKGLVALPSLLSCCMGAGECDWKV
jgi:hypothetical protein